MALGSTLATDERRARKVFARFERNGTGRVRVTPRLAELRRLIETGMVDKDIAAHLGLALGTVKVYASELYRLTGMRRREFIAVAKVAIVSEASGEPRMGAFE